MAQLSRPFQIALAALGLLVAVWFLALHGHSTRTSGSGSAPTPTTPAPSAQAQAQQAGSPSPIYHGSAPGVSGLTRAIAKAHGAVAASQQNAKKIEQKSAQASGPSAPSASTATGGTPAASAAAKRASTTAGAATLPKSAGAVHKGTTVHTGASTAHTGASAKRTAPLPAVQAPQRAVEAQLKKGEIVLLLFWNPKGADDAAVRNEVRALAAHGNKLAVHEALGSQVATFGSITRGVKVEQTPTILIINKRGHATTLTGLTDAFSLEQAIDEARHS
jgi:hypothetical protein